MAKIPDSFYLQQTLTNFKDNVSTHFPLGYVTDFYYIVATSTASSLTVLDVYVPMSLPGHGSHLRLDLTGVLDPILNATTSQFSNVSASSTLTFYEWTSVYWSYIIYLLTALYLIGRIIGSRIIPKIP